MACETLTNHSAGSCILGFVIASHKCYVRINLYLLPGEGGGRIQLFADGHRQSREGQTDRISRPA